MRYSPFLSLRFYSATTLLLFTFVANAQQTDLTAPPVQPDSTAEVEWAQLNWVDSVTKSLTFDEQIGQLFMVAAYSNRDQKHIVGLQELIEKQGIGGLIYFQGGPFRQVQMNNYLQSKSKIPMLIAMDAEWGAAMRLDSVNKFPRQMTMGAIQDDSLIYEMGAQSAEQLRRLGVHVSFSPVMDVNNNSKNPVINTRSFGEDRDNVARKGWMYAAGLQDNGVMAVAKHFPGHGDTDSDSHKTLPTISHNRNRLDSIELYPFKNILAKGVGGVMVAHLNVPSLDSSGVATTLSPKVVNQLLKTKMGYDGLIFTDALNMKGVANYYEPGEVDLKAILAGNDVLLFPENVPKAIVAIKAACASGKLDSSAIELRCRKILKAKFNAGLDNYKPTPMQFLHKDLNQPKFTRLQRELIENAITVVRAENDFPIATATGKNMVSISIGAKSKTAFQTQLDDYGTFTHFQTTKQITAEEKAKIDKAAADADHIIVGIHDMSSYSYRGFGLKKSALAYVEKLAKQKKLVLTFFGTPYALSKLSPTEQTSALLVAFEESAASQSFAAQTIFGSLAAKGKLPVSGSTRYPVGTGVQTMGGKMGFGIPEDFDLPNNIFEMASQIAQAGIDQKAYPGCQVLAAKGGRIVYRQNFGHFTYNNKMAVDNQTMYDIASITKIAATTASLMKLNSEGKIDLDYSLCDYLPNQVPDSTPYHQMTLREMLAHQAGLKPFIPFYAKTMYRGRPNFEIYSRAQSETYPNKVADKFYSVDGMQDSLWNWILETPLRKTKDYKYSDVGYYFMQRIIETISGKSLDQYVAENFYNPMGLDRITYKPTSRFGKDEITPTEFDLLFRKQQIQGDVHDPGAAMMGGIAGHAGVFSTATDLAEMMQMFLQDGTYGGKEYLDSATLAEFTDCQFCDDNRRAAGFDKPVMNGGGPTCNCVSFESFGHSGFTGTLAWADPTTGIVYIFLSNRIYPSVRNRKLASMNIRTDIQEAIYAAFRGKKKSSVFSQR